MIEDKHTLIFAKHRHFYDFYIKTGELVNFSHEVQSELLAAYRATKDAYYTYNNSCKVCVIEFLLNIYR
jgi:hypothetical protein